MVLTLHTIKAIPQKLHPGGAIYAQYETGAIPDSRLLSDTSLLNRWYVPDQDQDGSPVIIGYYTIWPRFIEP